MWRDVLSSKGSVDRGPVMAVAEGSSDGGSDDDWSYSGQLSLRVGRKGGRKGRNGCTRLECGHGTNVLELDPNFLGNHRVMWLERSKAIWLKFAGL
jgi:hypothetical protein